MIIVSSDDLSLINYWKKRILVEPIWWLTFNWRPLGYNCLVTSFNCNTWQVGIIVHLSSLECSLAFFFAWSVFKILQTNYEASGWVVHQVSDIWAKTSPDRGQAVWALWQMGGAWLCTHLWEHYTYTMDKVSLLVSTKVLQ